MSRQAQQHFVGGLGSGSANESRTVEPGVLGGGEMGPGACANPQMHAPQRSKAGNNQFFSFFLFIIYYARRFRDRSAARVRSLFE
jgi:hypothetical protein